MPLLAALALVPGAPAARAEGPRIVVVSHGQAADPFWSVVKNGVDRAAGDFDLDVDYLAPDRFDVIRMGRMIEAAVASRPAGLVVSIPDPDVQRVALARSRAQRPV